MNKKELKAMLKPLIKECIKEVIFEDGVLSGVVSEVARGLGGTQIVESQETQIKAEEQKLAETKQKSLQEHKQKINESRQKLLDAIGNEAYNGVNLFEGTTPLSSGGPAPGAAPEVQGPLAGVASADPGVDITNLVGNVGRSWKAHMDAGK